MATAVHNGTSTGGERPLGAFRRIAARAEQLLEAEREQLPLWTVVVFGAGIALWFAFGNAVLPPLLLLTLSALCLGYGLDYASRIGAAVAIAGMCLALGAADIAWRAGAAAPETLARPYFGSVTGRILEVERIPARKMIRWTVHPIGSDALPETIRLNVPASARSETVRENAFIRTKARLMPPAGPAVPGGYDFAARAWFDGLGATGSTLGAFELLRQGPAQGRLHRWRGDLSDHVRSRMSGAPGALGATLATGDKGAIDEDDAEAMRRSGMAHLLSISGLHVTAVVGAIYLLVSRLLALIGPLALRVPVPVVAAAAAAVAALGYTLLTGAQVPTIRACVATLLVLVAMALGRQAISLRLIAAGALLVLIIWPQSLTGPSFQLSFAAVIAIVALHELPMVKAFVSRKDRSWLSRTWRFVAGLFLTGLVVEIVLMPIAMYHFHKAGLYGPIANIFAIPLTTFVIMPLEALALLLDTVGLGGPVWFLCERALALLLTIAHVTASQPGSVATLPSMAPSAFGLAIGGGLMLCLLKTRVRYLGLLPLALGGSMAAATPMPDLLVTGDGRHIAFADGHSGIALLRGTAGDYVRELLGENAGAAGEASAIAEAKNARCSSDICVVQLKRGGRIWTIGATRSGYLVPSMELAAFCRRTDIMISDRWLPYSCRPRWLKVDRRSLERSGGLSIDLSEAKTRTVAERTGYLPWSTLERGPEARRIKTKSARSNRAKARAP
ncbi:ComEC/Rec2 family competence protein [Novosphingopyxis sp.]|uniref:ComEC/Rec2 family competence protein n=1 Tax=Novosphingopyxis sp. TaxID=2709690 RepID=UPI003B5C4D6C